MDCRSILRFTAPLQYQSTTGQPACPKIIVDSFHGFVRRLTAKLADSPEWMFRFKEKSDREFVVSVRMSGRDCRKGRRLGVFSAYYRYDGTGLQRRQARCYV